MILRFWRHIREWTNLLQGAFGSGIKRPFDRQALERFAGPAWSRIIVAVPMVTVTAWLLLWAVARIFDLPEGADPFAWIRSVLGK